MGYILFFSLQFLLFGNTFWQNYLENRINNQEFNNGTSNFFKIQNSKKKFPKLYPFRNDNKWGFCDKNKKIIIPCIYDRTWPFSDEGLAIVALNEIGRASCRERV